MDPVSLIGLIGSCVGITDGLAKICALASQYIHLDRTISQELGIWVFKLSQYKGVIDSIKLQAELDENSEEPLRLLALGLTDGPLHSCKLATECLKERLEKLPRKIVAGKVVFGKVIDGKTEVALKMFEDTMPVLMSALMSDQKTITSNVHEYVKDIKQDLRNFFQQQQDKQDAEAEAREIQELKEWLTPRDPTTKYRGCLKGTSQTSGRWFLDEEFGPWVRAKIQEDAKRIMWMRGTSGMGKTTLLSLAIKYLKREVGLEAEEGLAFCFCTSADAESQSAESMLRSFIKQLCDQNLPDAMKNARELRKLYEDDEDPEGINLSKEVFEDALEMIIGKTKKVVFFLDAPNESDQPERLIEAVSRIACSPKARVLISSTQALDICKLLEKSKVGTERDIVHVVDIPASKVDMDIADYISLTMTTRRELNVLSQDAKNTIQNKIADKAKGSFRWAKCQLDEIVRRSESPLAVDLALRSMASDLETFYQEILGEIPTYRAQPARMALLWLTFAIRPLNIDELAEAMGLYEPSEFANPSGRLFREKAEEILRSFRSLVDYNASTGLAQLDHDSVKQFLLSKFPKEGFSIEPVEGIGYLCSRMLRYLNLPRLSSGYCPKDELAARFEDSPLLKYISFALPRHLETSQWDSSGCGQAVEDDLKSLIGSAFHPCGGNFGTWIQVTGDPWDDLSKAPLYPFYHMAKRGYLRILTMIIVWDGDKDMEKPAGTSASTPLHAACFRGHTEVVRLLLSIGANPNEVNGNGTSGLEWARRRGYTEIVDLMTEKVAQSAPAPAPTPAPAPAYDYEAYGDYYGHDYDNYMDWHTSHHHL
ncbi:hypothetical protein HDK77DRAFT_498662 [Phyllosticta capitalensis]